MSRAYDVVWNGNEIGGGSIRINRLDVQRKVFDAIGIAPEDAAGSASASCSRRSSTARRRTAASPSASTASSPLLAGRDSIRDVIAFPKAASGADPLTGAPAEVDAEQLRELGIRVVSPNS